jgi:hypothetical protein
MLQGEKCPYQSLKGKRVLTLYTAEIEVCPKTSFAAKVSVLPSELLVRSSAKRGVVKSSVEVLLRGLTSMERALCSRDHSSIFDMAVDRW